MVRKYVLIVLLPLVWIGVVMASQAQAWGGTWDKDSRWRYVHPSDTAPSVPVRIVAPEEPWAYVIQDIQYRLGPGAQEKDVRVGFYGHGAFVMPATLQHVTPFVAALGETAAMDVMVFPQWQFPTTLPFLDLPRQLLQAQLNKPLQLPVETVVDLMRHKVRQLALDNRHATAHAAVRLAVRY